jgi:mercuric ion transport protein
LHLQLVQVLCYRPSPSNKEQQVVEARMTQTTLATATDRRGTAPSAGKAGLAATGGVLGALAASSCCILPLVLFTFGIGGAWIGNLTALEPYQPIFFAATAGFLGVGYFLVYRQPKIACADGTCTRSLPSAVVKAALWSATALVLAAVAFNFLAPLMLGA